MSDQKNEMKYAGDVTAKSAFVALRDDEDAILVDCRTIAEWTFVGIPDLSMLDKKPLFIEWQKFPSMEVNMLFTDILEEALGDSQASEATPIYFLCRSGARSQTAAIAVSALGYQQCYNICEGFEGDKDNNNHRGCVTGWKVAGLPWVQS